MLSQKELIDLSQIVSDKAQSSVVLMGELQELQSLKAALEMSGFHGFFQTDAMAPVSLVITDKYENSGPSRGEASPSGNNGGELRSPE